MNPLKEVKYIILHCSANSPKVADDFGVDELRNFHVNKRGWKDIGYHFVVRKDGVVEKGRDLKYEGAHTVGEDAEGNRYNAHSIGLCWVGGVDEDGNASGKTNIYQLTAWRALIQTLVILYPEAKVIGHRDMGANKACPSFDAEKFLNKYITRY